MHFHFRCPIVVAVETACVPSVGTSVSLDPMYITHCEPHITIRSIVSHAFKLFLYSIKHDSQRILPSQMLESPMLTKVVRITKFSQDVLNIHIFSTQYQGGIHLVEVKILYLSKCKYALKFSFTM